MSPQRRRRVLADGEYEGGIGENADGVEYGVRHDGRDVVRLVSVEVVLV